MKDRIVSELQHLFGRLEFGRRLYENPDRIVTSLGLKRSEQQDVNEFNNLFLQVIESQLKLTREVGVESLIEDEFKGTIIHTIECQHCKNRRENHTSFYDLTLQINKFKSLNECLIRHMRKEYLTGSNQYKCIQCHSLRDAERSTVISTLPPVLNLQLLRFDYDPSTGIKKKVQDNIGIPEVIDMTPFMNENEIDRLASELDMKGSRETIEIDDERGNRPTRADLSSSTNPYRYELTAILRHKGASAYHGHYIADIRDPYEPNKWWRFDDDSCKPIIQFDGQSEISFAMTFFVTIRYQYGDGLVLP